MTIKIRSDEERVVEKFVGSFSKFDEMIVIEGLDPVAWEWRLGKPGLRIRWFMRTSCDIPVEGVRERAVCGSGPVLLVLTWTLLRRTRVARSHRASLLAARSGKSWSTLARSLFRNSSRAAVLLPATISWTARKK